jgi:hypothetical protein
LALVQIPIAVYQAATVGLADPVQGTLYGKGSGAHLLGGVAVLVGMWLLAKRPRPKAGQALAASGLLLLPILADAKAILLAAVPVGLSMLRSRRAIVTRAVVIGGLLLVVGLYSAMPVAFGFVDRAGGGRWGKIVSAQLVFAQLRQSPESMLFGLGPASTVSRASFMTTSVSAEGGSPLHALGLHPSPFALSADLEANAFSGGGTSFNSAESSAIGVFGDLGSVGLAVYLLMVLAIVRQLLGRQTLRGRATAAMWVMFLILGVVFEWWEEPPFAITLALLTALTLTEEADDIPVRTEAESTRPSRVHSQSVAPSTPSTTPS